MHEGSLSELYNKLTEKQTKRDAVVVGCDGWVNTSRTHQHQPMGCLFLSSKACYWWQRFGSGETSALPAIIATTIEGPATVVSGEGFKV
jgi:hypothetical protein